MQRKSTASNRPRRPRALPRRRTSQVVGSNPILQVGSGQFVPKSTRVSLRFAATSDEKTPSISEIRVSGNNVVDPLGSTGSGAPPGFTYWASMYERYRVIGSRMRVYARFCSDTKDASTLTTAGKLVLLPSNNTTSFASGSDFAAQPYARQANVSTAQGASLSMTMKSGTILGQKDVLGPDRLQAVINTGPADEWFWRAALVPDNDVSTNTYCVLSFDCTYDVEFFDRKPLDRSSVMYYHKLAWLENCRLIAEEHKTQQAAREKQAQRISQLVESKSSGSTNAIVVGSQDVRNSVPDIEDYVPVAKASAPGGRLIGIDTEPTPRHLARSAGVVARKP